MHDVLEIAKFAHELITMQKHNRAIIKILAVIIAAFMSPGVIASGALGCGELRSLTAKDGLSDLLVNVIYKDSTGYVWFGTESGLDRFDGNRIKSFKLDSDSRNVSRRVNAITSGSNGSIFVGSNIGLFELLSGSSSLVRIHKDKLNGAVSSLVDDGKGKLYIGTNTGLYIYNDRKKELAQQLIVPDIMSPSNKIKALSLEPGKGLWILTQRGLHHFLFDNESISTYPIEVQSEGAHLSRIGNTLYVGTSGTGLLPFDIEALRFLPAIEVGNNVVTSICATDENDILVSTDGEGIFLYCPTEGRIKSHISTSETSRDATTLRSNSIYSTLVDDRGRLWVGYYQSGVDYTPSNNASFTLYSFPGLPDLSRSAVRSLSITGEQRLIGTHDGFFFVDERLGSVRHIHKPEIKSNLIFCVTAWGGHFYVGTYHGGMYVFDPKTYALRAFGPSEMAVESVFDAEIDSQNRLWVATSSGVYRFDSYSDKPAAKYTSGNSHLPSGNVYEIFFDSKGRGWLCTESGMAMWNGSTVSAAGFPKGFPAGAKIRAVYEDSKNRLYFVPDRGSIYRSNIELSKISVLGDESDDRFKMRTFVTEDLDGGLWVGTDKGLWRYRDGMQPTVINNLNGTPAPVFTLCPPYREKNGDIWFGTVNGLYKVNYGDFKKSGRSLISEVSIADVKSNGESVSLKMKTDRYKVELSLNSDESDIEIDVANFNFSNPEFFEVEYYLEGVDSGWRITNGAIPIHYFNLPSGTSKLHFRLPGEPGSEKIMTIRRASRVGIWVWLLSLIFVGVVVWLVIAYRHRSRLQAIVDYEDQADKDVETEMELRRASYKTTRLSDEECIRLNKKLDHLMKNERPYTNPDLKISDLAKMIDSTAHALSFLFNQYLKTSYYDYINGYRVAEFKRMVKELDTSKYTLTALSQKCGFSSRASFFRHFKNITGITPAEFLKKN